MKLFTLLTFLLFYMSFSKVYGFAENVTHGYPNCVACHASPTGGDMLTEYGRSLSKELMSTWGGWEGSEDPLFGAFKNGDTLKWGGDFRQIQTHRENDSVRRGQNFIMQSNLELGVFVDKIAFIGTLGTLEGPDGSKDLGTFLSERHYVLWETSPTSRLRVGKFRLRYGLNDPNHTRLIKGQLGFGFRSETYNTEYTHLNENYELSVSSSLGRIDLPRNASTERSLTSTFVHYLGGSSQLGTSLLLGESQQERRFLGGIFGVIPITKKWFTLFEVDYEESYLSSSAQDAQTTFANLVRIGHKTFKGFLPYFVFENSQNHSNTATRIITAPGLGIQWLPFPHVEFQIEYQRQTSNFSNGPTHQAWFLFHLYPF